MKTLYWDSADPLDVWDNPNLRWGDPSYRLEPGDEGYVPWSPGPEPTPLPRKPRARRRAVAPIPTNQPMSIQPFQYTTRTGTQNQITTSPDYRGTKTPAEVYAEIQARLGSTPPTIENVLVTFHELVIDWGKESWKIAPIADLLGYRFTSGGSEDESDSSPASRT